MTAPDQPGAVSVGPLTASATGFVTPGPVYAAPSPAVAAVSAPAPVPAPTPAPAPAVPVVADVAPVVLPPVPDPAVDHDPTVPDVAPVVEQQIRQPCQACGRVVQHDRATGAPQPHYKPRRGRVRCVTRSYTGG